MSEGGISLKLCCLFTQPNPRAETGGLDPVHVGEWIFTNGTRMDRVGFNSKGQHRYLRNRDVGVHVEDGGGRDGYPHLKSGAIS